MLVYSLAGRREDKMTIAVLLIAQEAEGPGAVEMYCVPDATCLSSAPLDDTRVC
jgi:hypothetical protein